MEPLRVILKKKKKDKVYKSLYSLYILYLVMNPESSEMLSLPANDTRWYDESYRACLMRRTGSWIDNFQKALNEKDISKIRWFLGNYYSPSIA